MEDNQKNVGGGMVISDDVIAAIAVNAAKDADGVVGFATRTPDFIQNVLKIGEDSNRAVRIVSGENDIRLHINIVVSGNAKIPEVAYAVQKNVKNAVQGMTGKVVGKVNVNIAGVEFEDEADAR